MENLITATEAKNLVSGSEERKSELIKLVNASIIAQSERGLRWSHLPSEISTVEENWLKDSLKINGFNVSDGHPAIVW